MLFDEYQEAVQIWRFTPPTDVYYEDEWLTDDGWALTIGYENISTSGGIYQRDLFRECRTNVDISLDVTGNTDVVLCGELEDNTFIPLNTFTAISGSNLLNYTISGLTFYTGLGFIFNTGVQGTVNYIYIGDKTYLTKDETYLDGVWKFIKNITMRIEPYGGSFNSLMNQQSFANISDMGFSPYDYKADILANDGIIDIDDIQRKVIGQPEWYKYEMPHIEVKLERVQFLVDE